MNPVEMLTEAARIYPAWWQAHADRLVAGTDLAEPVRTAADPDGRGRQYLAAKLRMLDGVRAAGLFLTRRPAVGRWSADRYLLQRVDKDDEEPRIARPPDGIAGTASVNADPARSIHAELEAARQALERAARQIAALYPEILRLDRACDAAIAAQEAPRE